VQVILSERNFRPSECISLLSSDVQNVRLLEMPCLYHPTRGCVRDSCVRFRESGDCRVGFSKHRIAKGTGKAELNVAKARKLGPYLI
jgi:hypothetical protein